MRPPDNAPDPQGVAYIPGHGHAALRRHRRSIPNAEYFLTICTDDRRRGLAEPSVAAAILAEAHHLTTEGCWHLRTATIMTDHLHVLVTLGTQADLSEVVRLFKGRLAPVLRRAGLRWQRGWYDHLLRDAEGRLPYFLYIFLNPHRANLIASDEKWAGYYCAQDDWGWLEPFCRGMTENRGINRGVNPLLPDANSEPPPP